MCVCVCLLVVCACMYCLLGDVWEGLEKTNIRVTEHVAIAKFVCNSQVLTSRGRSLCIFRMEYMALKHFTLKFQDFNLNHSKILLNTISIGFQLKKGFSYSLISVKRILIEF